MCVCLGAHALNRGGDLSFVSDGSERVGKYLRQRACALRC